jgi:hypothetical protein
MQDCAHRQIQEVTLPLPPYTGLRQNAGGATGAPARRQALLDARISLGTEPAMTDSGHPS